MEFCQTEWKLTVNHGIKILKSEYRIQTVLICKLCVTLSAAKFVEFPLNLIIYYYNIIYNYEKLRVSTLY